MWWWITLVVIVFGGIVTALILLGGFFMVAQGQAAIIERLGKFNRVVYSGLHVRIPFLETFRVVGYVNRPEFRKDYGAYRIDLREQIFDISKQHVITKDNVPLEVDTIVYYRITEPEETVYGISDLPKAIEQLALTNIRNEFGRMDMDKSLGARSEINETLKKDLDEATATWGIEVLRVEVQEIVPPADLKETMEKQMMAERDRRVQVSIAEAEKQTTILRAEGAKQQIILAAEAEKAQEVMKAEAEKIKIILAAEAERDRQILMAQGKKEAYQLESEGEKVAKINQSEGDAAGILKTLNAQAEGLAQISQALNAQDSNQALLALKALEASVQIAAKLGDGQATKIFLPQEVAGVMGTLLSITEGIKTFKD